MIPDGWLTPFFGWHLNLDWTGLIDAVNTKIAQDGYGLFGFFFIMLLFQGILKSAAGPAPNYDMQRVLATRSPEGSCEDELVCKCCHDFPPLYVDLWNHSPCISVISPRSCMQWGSNIDFEMILPDIIRNVLPVGLVGLFLCRIDCSIHVQLCCNDKCSSRRTL